MEAHEIIRPATAAMLVDMALRRHCAGKVKRMARALDLPKKRIQWVLDGGSVDAEFSWRFGIWLGVDKDLLTRAEIAVAAWDKLDEARAKLRETIEGVMIDGN